jgi:hypothetical protein
MDYTALVRATVKNGYRLPLILDMVDGLHRHHINMKTDLSNAYHLIGNKEEDEYKSSFYTEYRHC